MHRTPCCLMPIQRPCNDAQGHPTRCLSRRCSKLRRPLYRPPRAALRRELADRRSPALDYDRAWALTLLDRVFARLRSECEDDGNSGRFEVLQNFLQGERGELPLAQAAATLALSLPALKSLVHRLRQRFREMIREEVRETVSADADVATELQHLFAALGR